MSPLPSPAPLLSQSWAHGQMLLRLEPEAVQLVKSHGYETDSSKLVMRMTVILSDVLGKSVKH